MKRLRTREQIRANLRAAPTLSGTTLQQCIECFQCINKAGLPVVSFMLQIQAVNGFYLCACHLLPPSGSRSCWEGQALRLMVMMGLAKMKQTIQMGVIYRT